jgi:hypothetical protein
MNNLELQHRLTEKIATLPSETLDLIWKIVEDLTKNDLSVNNEEYRIETLLQKWQYLIKNNQELEPDKPLNNQEIKLICQSLSQSQESRPVGLADGEFIVPDNFNEPFDPPKFPLKRETWR